MIKPRFQRLLLPVGLVAIFILGFTLAKTTAAPPATSDNSALAAKYNLLSRRTYLDSPNDTLLNFVPLRKTIQDKLGTLNVPYSFTFEYLPTGTSIRAGDGQEMVGASLIKLPVVMDLYRLAELGKINLDETETLTADELNDQFGDLYKRGVGAKVTLREAAKYALSQSDNTAIITIQKRIKDYPMSTNALEAVDADYDAGANQVLINSKSFASVLKCLYYACYINRDDSQEILGYLTQSDFNAGIAKPIDNSMRVAHKIGVEANKLSQSDCGIIYLPRRPYLLCVMVGLPLDQADALMSDLSGLVYDTLSKHTD
jgi:beta-lactamase class A